MTEKLEHRDRVARKKHICNYCGGVIEKGETYDYYKGVFDGDVFEWKSHLACQRVADAIWDYADPDDGMSDQMFQDNCREVCQQFICPDCPKWNKEYADCDDDETFCIDRMDDFFKVHELYLERREGYYTVWKCREKE